MITQTPYTFYRSFSDRNFKDLVVVAMNLEAGKKTLNVVPVFNEGLVLHDAYSNQDVTVKIGKVELDSEYDIVLLEAK